MVRARARGKARTTFLAAPATTSTTIVGAPRCDPSSTIPGPTISQCGKGCVLRSSSQRIHHNTPCSLHRHTMGLPVVPPSRPYRFLHRTSSKLRLLLGHHGQACGISSNSFNTMALTPPTVTDWVTDSGASNHTTSDAGNLTSIRSPTFTDSSYIVVRNGSALPVRFTLIMSLLLMILLKIFYLFIVLPLTIDVP
jgi:hypothetical protein